MRGRPAWGRLGCRSPGGPQQIRGHGRWGNCLLVGWPNLKWLSPYGGATSAPGPPPPRMSEMSAADPCVQMSWFKPCTSTSGVLRRLDHGSTLSLPPPSPLPWLQLGSTRSSLVMAPRRKSPCLPSLADAPHRKRRRVSPSFWTRRQADVASSDIESDSPARPLRTTQIDPTEPSSECSPTAAWPIDSRFREAAGSGVDTVVPRLRTPGGAPTRWVASHVLPQLLGRYYPKERQRAMPEPLAPAPPPLPGPAASIGLSAACFAEVGEGASLPSRGPAALQVPCPAVRPVTSCVVLLTTDTASRIAR